MVNGHVLVGGVGCSVACDSLLELPGGLAHVSMLGGTEGAVHQVNHSLGGAVGPGEVVTRAVVGVDCLQA